MWNTSGHLHLLNVTRPAQFIRVLLYDIRDTWSTNNATLQPLKSSNTWRKVQRQQALHSGGEFIWLYRWMTINICTHQLTFRNDILNTDYLYIYSFLFFTVTYFKFTSSLHQIWQLWIFDFTVSYFVTNFKEFGVIIVSGSVVYCVSETAPEKVPTTVSSLHQ